MARSAVLAIRILADSSQARRELGGTERQVGKFSGALSKATGPALAVVGGLGLVGKAATDAASDLQQSTGAVQSVFGKYANTIITNAKAAAQAVGLSQSAYQTQAVLLGSQLKNLGLPIKKATDATGGLIKKAADLAATFGGSTAEAVEAMGSLLRGETDPIERYGVSINQAAVQSFILSHHLKNATTAQQKNAKRTAIMALLYKQTAAATGQFRRETTSVAGAQEIANAKFENAKAALGKRLLPIVAKFKTILSDVAGWLTRNSGAVFTLAGVLGGAAAAVLAINTAVKIWTATVKAYTAVQKLLNFVIESSPIFRIALVVLAIAAALVLAYKRSATFRAIVQAAMHAVMAVVAPLARFFIKSLPAAFLATYRGLRAAWSAVVGFLRTWAPRALLVLAPFIGIPLLIWRHFAQIKQFLAGVWDSVTGRARSFVSTLVGVVRSIPGRIASVASGMLRTGKNMIDALFRGVANSVRGIGSFVSDIAHSIVNAIISGINAALNLPWSIKLHIGIPMAPDVNFGPYTLLPKIPLWASAPPGPALNYPAPSLDELRPGWSLFAAAASWRTAPLGPASGRNGSTSTPVFMRVTFDGLVTDPDAVARKIETLLDRRRVRTTR